MSFDKLPNEIISRICEQIHLDHERDEYHGKDSDGCCEDVNWTQPYRQDLRPLLTVNKRFRDAALEQWHHTLTTNIDWYRLKLISEGKISTTKRTRSSKSCRRAACQRLEELANNPRLSVHVRKIILCDRLFPSVQKWEDSETAQANADWTMALLAKFTGLQEISVNSSHRERYSARVGSNDSNGGFTAVWNHIFQHGDFPKLRRVNFPQLALSQPLVGNQAENKAKSPLTAMTVRLGSDELYLDPEPALYGISGLSNLQDLTLGWTALEESQFVFPIDLIDLPSLRKFHLISCSSLDAAATEGFIKRYEDQLEAFCLDATNLAYGSWEVVFEALVPCKKLKSLCFAGLGYELGPPIRTASLKMAALVSHRYEDYLKLADLLRAYQARRGDLDSDFLSWNRPNPTARRPVCYGWEYLLEYETMNAIKEGIVFGNVGGTDGSDLTW